MPTNEFGQAIGPPLPDWTPRPCPPRTPLAGRFCRVEPLDPRTHARGLYETIAEPADDGRWTYLPYGPFSGLDGYRRWVDDSAECDDPLFFAIVNTENRPVGIAAYMRIDGNAGVIEIGHLNFSTALRRTAAATEAMYLMMRRVFEELGYRRYEWKCDHLNEPSRRAALRLGFTYEGLFRQATVYKRRSRDTAWYSITDSEWPARKAAFEGWLSADNIDESGMQRRTLSEFMGG